MRLTSEEPLGAAWPPAPTPAGPSLGNGRPCASEPWERGTQEAQVAAAALAQSREETASLGLTQHLSGENGDWPSQPEVKGQEE